MENILDKVTDELQLNRSDWKLVKFGDVAIQQKQSVDRDNTELTRYVKGEHMGSEDLHLREWGELTDEYLGPAFIRKFEEGDILYGSRRTYLRKVVIAPVDGITSNTTFVIKANEKRIDKRLLPFIMLSEGFAENSIKNSKGSVNPYINWKDISEYEFLLPPKDQQAQLAELLWAMDDVIEKEKELLEKLKKLMFKEREFFFIKGSGAEKTLSFSSFIIPKHWSVEKINSVANVEYGISESVANNTDPDIGWQIITGANINIDGSLDLTKKRYIEIPTNERFMLKRGDLLFNWRSGSPEHIGKTAIFDLSGNYTYASFVLRIRCGNKLESKFAFYLFNYLREIEYFSKNIAQQVNFKINASVFREVEIPIPPIEEQKKIIKKLQSIHLEMDNVKSKIDSSMALRKSLISQIF
jgi:type I restriction enzyme S subunit